MDSFCIVDISNNNRKLYIKNADLYYAYMIKVFHGYDTILTIVLQAS